MGAALRQSRLTRILLWLFVVNLGIALGAGLYEARIAFPDWLVVSPDAGVHWNAAAARRDDTGLRFWVFVTTAPLTLLTIANLWAAWRAVGPARRWWIASGVAALGDRVLTFAYFIPTMVWLLESPDSAESVSAAVRWGNLNYVRHALVLTAWLAALKTFALVHETGGREPGA